MSDAMDSRLLSAAEFAARKYDLPDGGRWTELVAGRLVDLHPPDEAHGTTVLNLSKSLAEHFCRETDAPSGYACFELGLLVARAPDTVRVPAMCCFVGAAGFEEADKVLTQKRPDLVAEIASTNDRRRSMPQRIDEYAAWGVELVWVADPLEKQVHVFRHGRPPRSLASQERLLGHPVLPGFGIRVEALFAEPEWWRTPGPAGRRPV